MARRLKVRRLSAGGAIGRNLVSVLRGEEAGGVTAVTFRDARAPARVEAPEPTTAPAPLTTQPDVDVAAIERSAYERGFAEGQNAAASAAESMLSRFDGAIGHLSRALEKTEETATRDSVKLALRIAEKLVRKAMAEDPETLAAAVVSAVQHTAGDEPLTVTFDGSTATGLKLQIDELVQSLGISRIDVTEDPTLSPGDLMLSRGSTMLDARITTRVDRIERALMRELGMAADQAIEAEG